jgi:hypothetical protein
VFHGPRGLAYFTPQGLTITEEMQQVLRPELFEF